MQGFDVALVGHFLLPYCSSSANWNCRGTLNIFLRGESSILSVKAFLKKSGLINYRRRFEERGRKTVSVCEHVKFRDDEKQKKTK